MDVGATRKRRTKRGLEIGGRGGVTSAMKSEHLIGCER